LIVLSYASISATHKPKLQADLEIFLIEPGKYRKKYSLEINLSMLHASLS